MRKIVDPNCNSNTLYFEGHRSNTFNPRLVIERRFTKNYVGDPQHYLKTVPIPPRNAAMWCFFDIRSDEKTGWRRISLEYGDVS
jgi:hypothetical protein